MVELSLERSLLSLDQDHLQMKLHVNFLHFQRHFGSAEFRCVEMKRSQLLSLKSLKNLDQKLAFVPFEPLIEALVLLLLVLEEELRLVDLVRVWLDLVVDPQVASKMRWVASPFRQPQEPDPVGMDPELRRDPLEHLDPDEVHLEDHGLQPLGEVFVDPRELVKGRLRMRDLEIDLEVHLDSLEKVRALAVVTSFSYFLRSSLTLIKNNFYFFFLLIL